MSSNVACARRPRSMRRRLGSFTRRSGSWPSPTVLAAKAQALDRRERRRMVEKDHPHLSIGERCRLLPIARAVLPRAQGRDRAEPRPDAPDRQAVPETPCLRRAPDDLAPAGRGHAVTGARIRRLMRLPSRLELRPRGPMRNLGLGRVLQQLAAPRRPGRSHPGRRTLARKRNGETRRAGQGQSLKQRENCLTIRG